MPKFLYVQILCYKCIDIMKRSLDYYLECIYISDTKIEETEFLCENRKLVHKYLRCDAIDNCGDTTDETDCTGSLI